MTSGSCLCGSVRYTIEGPFTMLGHCHCSMCRKHHGSMFATWTGSTFAGFRWLSGADNITTYQSSNEGTRSFCRTCGSVTPVLHPESDSVFLPAGNLEGDFGLRPQFHMFAASKAPWWEIADDLPRHDRYPPPYDALPGVQRETTAADDGVTRGSCVCGDVAFEFDGKPERMYNCHCTRCRRARSAAHGTNMFVRTANFRWMRGEDQVISYKLPEAKRFGQAFCSRCGSATARIVREFDVVNVPAGSLDSEPAMRPMGHLYVGSKAPWYSISDRLPQFAEMPPPA